MAQNSVPATSQPEIQTEQEKLKFTSFVQEAAKLAVPYASKAYDYAKDKSGTLKPGVEAIETTVKTVVGPAYETFQDVPNEVLKIVDRKVDESVNKAMSTNVAKDFKNRGVVETSSGLAKTAYKTLEPTRKELLKKYEPVAEQHATSAWQSLNKMSFFRSVANEVIPTASYLSEKYNETVQQTTEEGYQVSSYLPLVPTQKISKVFKDTESVPKPEPVVSSGDEGAVVAH